MFYGWSLNKRILTWRGAMIGNLLKIKLNIGYKIGEKSLYTNCLS